MVKLAELKANQLIKSLPYTAFHVSEIDKALMTFGKGAHIGKIVVSYDHHEEAGLKVRPPLNAMVLILAEHNVMVGSPEPVQILVRSRGCLPFGGMSRRPGPLV